MGKGTELNTIKSSQSFLSEDPSTGKISVPGKKKVVVGIVPRLKEIILVKTEKKPSGNLILLDYYRYSVPDGVELNSPVYAKILNTAVSSFCSLDKHYETWCVIPSIDVQTKFLELPRVSINQLYKAVYWSYKNEISFDEEKSIFDFDIIGNITDDGIEKTEILAYSVPLEIINTVKHIFTNAAIRLDGISIVAFGIQNLLRTQFLKPGCETVCTLFIGTDWSRIDVFTENHLYLSRDIKTGYQSFLHSIEDILPQKDLSESELAKIAEDFFIHQLVYSETTNCDENKHFSKIESVTDRLVKQIARTFEYFVSNSGKEPVQKLYLTGRLCDFEGLIDYLSKKLGIPVEIIDSFSGSQFQNTPELNVKSVSDLYLPAFGMSLSDTGHTPNFINTFKDRQSIKKSKLIDRIFVASIVLFLVVLSGTTYWQRVQIKNKKIQAEQITNQLESMGPLITKDMIAQKSTKLLNYQKRVKTTADHFSSLAAISEICKLTSKNIQLFDMAVVNLKTDGLLNRSLTAKGYIFEHKLQLDAALAGYRETLNSSSLFDNITVIQKTFLEIQNKDAISFEIKMDINRQQDA